MRTSRRLLSFSLIVLETLAWAQRQTANDQMRTFQIGQVTAAAGAIGTFYLTDPAEIGGLSFQAGTLLRVKILNQISSLVDQSGTAFTGLLVVPLQLKGQIVVNAGAQVRGSLALLRSKAHPDGRCYDLLISQIADRGKTFSVYATLHTPSLLKDADAISHANLAAVLYRAGKYEEATTESRVALFYDPRVNGAKQMLTAARTKLSETGGAAATSTPQGAQIGPASLSGGLVGSTWTCQLVQANDNGSSDSWSLSATFLENGTAKVMNTQYGVIFYDYPPKWELNGSNIKILTSQEHNGDDFVGTMNSPTSMTFRIVGHPGGSYDNDSGSLTCNRLTPLPPPQPAAQAQPSPNHPPYDDKCLRTGQGNLGSVTITNICTQPIDLKFCYRKQGDNGPWTCTVTPRLEPNHTLPSPFCNQCAYDGRAAAYLSSRNLLGSLPSDAEVASWTGSGPPPGQNSSASGGQGSSDGQRQWHFVNPAQNWDTLTFEIRGRNGDSTSDDWNDEATLRTVTLKPGESWTQDCGSYFSLDIKWQLASASDPQVDTFFNSLVCYANNFVWTNNHNLREYDFPRQ
jgi:hypothetical protein